MDASLKKFQKMFLSLFSLHIKAALVEDRAVSQETVKTQRYWH